MGAKKIFPEEAAKSVAKNVAKEAMEEAAKEALLDAANEEAEAAQQKELNGARKTCGDFGFWHNKNKHLFWHKSNHFGFYPKPILIICFNHGYNITGDSDVGNGAGETPPRDVVF